jgi:hypothetical protein
LNSAAYEEEQLYGDSKKTGGHKSKGGGGKKKKPVAENNGAAEIPFQQSVIPVEEDKKEEHHLVHHRKKVELKKRESRDLDNIDPLTFKERFTGFNKDDYEEIAKKNEEFFEIGFSKYIKMVKRGKFLFLKNS